MSPVLAYNSKAHFDYEIIKKFSAGLELLGHEVKSVRNGGASLAGSYVSIRGKEAFLLGANINPYQPKNIAGNYDPRRARKLLLDKSEIEELETAENTKGLTIVPLSVYNKGRKIKVEIALVKGKKKHDKRETLKKRDTEREIRREYK